MRTERTTESGRNRRARVDMPRRAPGHGSRVLYDVLRTGRELPRVMRHEVQARPELVLATVSGVSFLAGALLGSKVGRALMAALIPLGLQRVLETEIGPRLWEAVRGFVDEAANTNGSGEPPS